MNTAGPSRTEKKKAVKEEGSKKVFEDDQIVILNILNKEASCTYGKSTKWCISADKSSNYWDQYYMSDLCTFYFVIVKDTKEKYAACVYPEGRIQIFDPQDHSISMKEFEKRIGYNPFGD